MPLKNCIKVTSGLNEEDVSAVLEGYDAYSGNMTDKDASILAIDDALVSLQDERADLLGEIYQNFPEIDPAKQKEPDYTQDIGDDNVLKTESERPAQEDQKQENPRRKAPNVHRAATERNEQEASTAYLSASNGEVSIFVHRSRKPKVKFSDDRLGGNTKSPVALLGHYLVPMDTGDAYLFGEELNVVEFQFNKPLIVSHQEFIAISDLGAEGVIAFREALLSDGHDGLLVDRLDYAIALNGADLTIIDDAAKKAEQPKPLVKRKVVKPQVILRNGEVVTDGITQPYDFVQNSPVSKTEPKSHISPEQVKKIVALIRKELPGAADLDIHVYDKQDEAFGKDSMKKHGRIKGGFYAGSNEMVLITENLKSTSEAITVIRHELVGHFGFRAMLNKDGQFDKILERVYAAKDGDLKKEYDWVAKYYPELIAENNVRVIADEMIARAAETKSKAGILDKIYDMIVKLLREVGLAPDSISRKEIESLVRLSENNLRKQANLRAEKVNTVLSRKEDQAESVEGFASNLEKELGLKTLLLSESKGDLKLTTIIVPKENRKKGIGTEAMKRITEYADANNLRIVLSPAQKDDFQGVTSRGRLVKFYKSFGFIENKGRNKDFEISEGMYRDPEERSNLLFRKESDNANDAPTNGSLGMPDETLKGKFVRLAQDSFNRVKDLQQNIKEKGGTVRLESDVYGAEERSSSKISYRLQKLDKEFMKPLLSFMDKNDISIEELDEFVIARHAKERNEYIATINEDMPDGGSGMTDVEAEQVLNDMADKRAVLEEAAEFIYQVNNDHLDNLVEGGHLEQSQADEWKARYKYYVPLKGKKDDPGGMGTGSGFSISGAGIKRAMGRGAGNISESPTAHAFAQAETAIVRTEKTKVGQALIQLVRDNPDPDLWTISERQYQKFEDLFGEPFEGYETAPEGLIENLDYHRVYAISAGERQLARDEGRKPVGKVVFKLDPNYKQRDDVFSVMIDGKELLVQIKDKVLIEQLKKMNVTQLNAVVAGFGTVNRYLAMINTALNPEFVITNFERDFQTAMVNLGGEHSAEIAYDVMKSIPGAMRGIWQATFDTKGKSEWRTLFDEMQEEGGSIGFFGLEDIDTKVKHIQNRLTNKHGVLGKTRKGINAVRDAVLDANLSVENAARLAAYKIIRDKSIANGMSQKEAKARAASVSKNLTVNFNRKGELAPVLNSAYLFYNASIQGSARIITALKYPRVRKIVGGVAATAFALAMYNRDSGGDDDDGIPHWDKVSDYLKQTNLIIMHPDGSGNFSKIKLPYGYNVFFYSGVAMHDMMFAEDKTAAKTSMNMLSAMMNAFNPISGADLMDTLTPTVMKPYEQDVRNINFMAGPLKPEYPFDQYDRPESQKRFKSTNPKLVEMMDYLNEATGGDETHSGLIDISPEIVKHYTSWLTGGAGMTATRAVGTAINLATGEDIDQRNVPFARTLGGKTGSHYDTERFYAAVKEVAAVEAQLKIYKGTDEWGEYRDKHSELHKLAIHVRRYKNRIKRLREDRDKAYFNEDKDLANDKKEAIRQEMMKFSIMFDEAQEADSDY